MGAICTSELPSVGIIISGNGNYFPFPLIMIPTDNMQLGGAYCPHLIAPTPINLVPEGVPFTPMHHGMIVVGDILWERCTCHLDRSQPMSPTTISRDKVPIGSRIIVTATS